MYPCKFSLSLSLSLSFLLCFFLSYSYSHTSSLSPTLTFSYSLTLLPAICSYLFSISHFFLTCNTTGYPPTPSAYPATSKYCSTERIQSHSKVCPAWAFRLLSVFFGHAPACALYSCVYLSTSLWSSLFLFSFSLRPLHFLLFSS